MLPRPYYFRRSPQEYSYAFAFLLIISTIVIADPNSQLDLPDNFNNLNVDTIFSREENMRENKEEEREWRKPEQKQKREVRWGNKSIYEGDQRLEPFGSSSKNVSKVNKTPEAAPQFQLRF